MGFYFISTLLSILLPSGEAEKYCGLLYSAAMYLGEYFFTYSVFLNAYYLGF